jgi:hypothetical protein
MHNWMEIHVTAREKMADAIRSAEEARRAGISKAGRSERRPASLILARGEVVRIRVKRGILRVTCRTGRLWATSSLASADTLLAPEDSVTYGVRGTVVVEALRTATLRLEYRDRVHVELGAPLRPALLLG